MEYSPFLEQNGGVNPFRFAPLDLTLTDPLGPPGEPDGPLSVQSRVGSSFAEAFGEESPSLHYTGGNPFADYASHRAPPQSGFSFTSQPGTPSESGPFSSDLQSMSLDPPRRQRGHRRAQSDACVSLQPIGTRRPDQEPFEDLAFLEQGGLNGDMDHQQGRANGSSSSKPVEALDGLEMEELQNILKSKSAENLSLDPKKARRIIANRQSAARSKEKKIRYIADLEVRMQQLQSETTSLKTLMSVLENDTASLNSENRELKQSLQDLENQAQLRDGLNERLRREVMQLKQKVQQVQQGPHVPQGGSSFMQDGFSDQQALLDDLLSPNGGIESPTLSSNQEQRFHV